MARKKKSPPPKKRGPKKGQGGRPRIEINWDHFDDLCGLQCTLEEIAGWFKCSEDTIERACRRKYGITFAEAFAQKRASGKISLRRAQYQAAKAGDRTMLIWLGKQWLGQKEPKQPFEHTGADGGPITVKTEVVFVSPSSNKG